MKSERQRERKKKLAMFCVLLSLLLLLCGCPYESSFPLSPPAEAKIDDQLIGAWLIVSDGETKGGTALFYPISENEFIIAICEPKKEEGEIVLFKAFVATIRNSRFLNIQEIGPVLQKKWYLVNYSLSGDTLTTKTVQGNIFKDKKIASASDLRSFLERNLANPGLYSSSDSGSNEFGLKRINKPIKAP